MKPSPKYLLTMPRCSSSTARTLTRKKWFMISTISARRCEQYCSNRSQRVEHNDRDLRRMLAPITGTTAQDALAMNNRADFLHNKCKSGFEPDNRFIVAALSRQASPLPPIRAYGIIT